MGMINELIEEQHIEDQIKLLKWVISLCFNNNPSKEHASMYDENGWAHSAFVQGEIEKKIKELEEDIKIGV